MSKKYIHSIVLTSLLVAPSTGLAYTIDYSLSDKINLHEVNNLSDKVKMFYEGEELVFEYNKKEKLKSNRYLKPIFMTVKWINKNTGETVKENVMELNPKHNIYSDRIKTEQDGVYTVEVYINDTQASLEPLIGVSKTSKIYNEADYNNYLENKTSPIVTEEEIKIPEPEKKEVVEDELLLLLEPVPEPEKKEVVKETPVIKEPEAIETTEEPIVEEKEIIEETPIIEEPEAIETTEEPIIEEKEPVVEEEPMVEEIISENSNELKEDEMIKNIEPEIVVEPIEIITTLNKVKKEEEPTINTIENIVDRPVVEEEAPIKEETPVEIVVEEEVLITTLNKVKKEEESTINTIENIIDRPVIEEETPIEEEISVEIIKTEKSEAEEIIEVEEKVENEVEIIIEEEPEVITNISEEIVEETPDEELITDVEPAEEKIEELVIEVEEEKIETSPKVIEIESTIE